MDPLGQATLGHGHGRDDVPALARTVGLRGVTQPTFERVERRRVELMALGAFLLVALLIGVLLLVVTSSASPDLQAIPFLVLAAITVAFVSHVVIKHRQLRRLGNALVNERVMAAALENRLKEVSLLAEAGRAVTSSLDLRSTLGVILTAASELLEADEGSVMLLEDHALVVLAATGHASWFLGQGRGVTEGVGGYVVRTRQPLLIEGEVEMAELTDMLSGPGHADDRVLSALCVPLLANDTVLGVLSLNITHGDRRYEEYDLRTLELFAQQASIAIHRAQILEEAEDSTREQVAELEGMHAEALRSVVSVVEPPSQWERAGSRSRRHHNRLLLVDDDPDLLRFLRFALEDEGWDVSLASDGQTALRRIETERPDLVLLDLTLPLLDGWQVLERIRSSDHRPRIVCLTGKTARRDRMRAWTLGVHEFVAKPFQLPDLVTLLDDVASRSETEQDDRREHAIRSLFAG